MKTRIFNTIPGKPKFLMNEIDAHSKFQDTKCPSHLGQHTAEGQMAMAEDIVLGWKMHGNHPMGTTYQIEQGNF